MQAQHVTIVVGINGCTYINLEKPSVNVLAAAYEETSDLTRT